MTNTIQTNPSYFVLCGQHIDEFSPERNVKDMDRAGTIKDIAAGQFENLTRVIEIGTGADVTADFARAVMTIWASQGEPLSRWQAEFVETHVSVQAANSFSRAA